MRVLQLIKNFDFGGAENHLCELANSLDSLGNKVYIIAGNGRQKIKLNNTITFISLRLKDVLFPFHLLIICYYIIHHKIQIIHAHQRFPIFLASIAGKITGVPVVATVHGRSQYDLRSRFSRKFSQKIIFVSQFVLKASIRFPEIQYKSVFIPNGVTITNNKTALNIGQISYISRIDKRHSSVILLMIQEILPRMVIDFPMVTFNIIGEGDYLPKVKEEALRLNKGLNKEVCIISGYRADINEIIQNSTLVMGVGRVALESLACSTPILSINQKRMGTIVTSDNYAFYKANNFVAVGNSAPDSDSLLHQLQIFFNNLPLYQKEAEIIQKYIDEEFNSIKIAVQIENLYNELIK